MWCEEKMYGNAQNGHLKKVLALRSVAYEKIKAIVSFPPLLFGCIFAVTYAQVRKILKLKPTIEKIWKRVSTDKNAAKAFPP